MERGASTWLRRGLPLAQAVRQALPGPAASALRERRGYLGAQLCNPAILAARRAGPGAAAPPRSLASPPQARAPGGGHWEGSVPRPEGSKQPGVGLGRGMSGGAGEGEEEAGAGGRVEEGDERQGAERQPRSFTWRVNHMVSFPSLFDDNEQAFRGARAQKHQHLQTSDRFDSAVAREDARSRRAAVVIPRPARIILIRHGESEGNRDEGVYTSRPDWKIGLTNVGKMQAVHAGKRLKELVGNGDVYIYHSPYIRAVETTTRLLKHLDHKQVRGVREEPRIAEQQFGNLRDIDTIRRCKEERKRFGRFFYRFPDGEAGLDVYSRVTSFMGTLRRDHLEENCTVVIVTHGLALRLFLMRWFQWTVEQFEATHNPPNCGIAVMNRLPADGRYRLTKDTLDMIGAENAPTTTAIGRFMLRKQATTALLSNL